MKVLYIGHYKEFGGWGQAAIDQILALDSAGVDVVCRNVTLTKDKEGVNSRILELEKKDSDGCDVCIQHVLPHHIVGSDMFRKNIAFTELESSSIKHLAWFENLKLVDQVWVANKDLKESLDNDKLGIDVRVVPHACDTSKYKKQYQQIRVAEAEGKFKFYYIGDLNARKNIESIITCFNSEFDKYEDVCMILKVNKFGVSKDELGKKLDEYLAGIKKSLRIYNNIQDYPKEITITESLSDDQVCTLHQYGDCFVCPTRGEAWSIPSFDAMAFGSTPICSNYGGPKEFVDRGNWRTGHLINGVYACCKYPDPAFPDLFSAKEYWFQPSEMDIRNQMRQSYNSWKKDPISYKSRNQAAGLKQAEKYSYNNIGKLMKEIINE